MSKPAPRAVIDQSLKRINLIDTWAREAKSNLAFHEEKAAIERTALSDFEGERRDISAWLESQGVTIPAAAPIL